MTETEERFCYLLCWINPETQDFPPLKVSRLIKIKLQLYFNSMGFVSQRLTLFCSVFLKVHIQNLFVGIKFTSSFKILIRYVAD